MISVKMITFLHFVNAQTEGQNSGNECIVTFIIEDMFSVLQILFQCGILTLALDWIISLNEGYALMMETKVSSLFVVK